MNQYNFNKKRYCELRDEEENLKNKGTSLYWVDKQKYRELVTYKARLEEHRFWKNKEKYFSIIIEFLNGKLTGDDFTSDFLHVWRMLRDDTLDETMPISESEGFGKYVDMLFFCCEEFDDEASLSEPYGENWLKNEVEEIWVKLQKEYKF